VIIRWESTTWEMMCRVLDDRGTACAAEMLVVSIKSAMVPNASHLYRLYSTGGFCTHANVLLQSANSHPTAVTEKAKDSTHQTTYV
jgi:hypothetical protein